MNASFHRIVVATDFSADAEHAVRAASELSHVYAAPLTLVHVYDPLAYPVCDGYVMCLPVQLARISVDLESRLARSRQEACAAGAIDVSTRLLEGVTASEIVRFAKDGGYDLIVTGTHGRKGLSRVLLGSVAARVVQTAVCPVLTVRRPVEHVEAATLQHDFAASPAS
jgi:nucleotide-binding universal stress UspA family protein